MSKNELMEFLYTQPIINSHSHHMPDSDHCGLNLQRVMSCSYVNWCGAKIPTERDREKMTQWLSAVRTRSYFVCMERALKELYHIDEPLTAKTWDVFDDAITRAHSDSSWHLRILSEKCNYKTTVLDAYWAPGSDNNHPELFSPAYRINSFFFGYNLLASDHNGNNILRMHGANIADIEEYTAFLDKIIGEQKDMGRKMLKCALAYDRGLDFGPSDKSSAQRAMCADPSMEDIVYFQDYIFDHICKSAARLNMPLQIHTGLGKMDKSNAMQLRYMISANPETTFVLMHGSYPWISDIAGLAHVFKNTWVDLCWLPLISGAAATRLLDELLDVCEGNRVIWGCDTWTGEESFGARLAIFDILSAVLSERVEKGMMRTEDAKAYAKAVLFDNAANLLGI